MVLFSSFVFAASKEEDKMGLFKKSCPLEKSHLEVYGIHSPRKWKPEDCVECEFWQDQKCQYKEIMSTHQKLIQRGRPVLAKKAAFNQTVIVRKQYEEKAVQLAGFTVEEIKEYWELSTEFDRQWESQSAEKKQEILDSLDQWKVHLEKGDSPALAGWKVHEWLEQRERFRRSSENAGRDREV
jgi:hypothetical protein